MRGETYALTADALELPADILERLQVRFALEFDGDELEDLEPGDGVLRLHRGPSADAADVARFEFVAGFVERARQTLALLESRRAAGETVPEFYERPGCYAGETFEGTLAAAGMSRDSDALEATNFAAARARLEEAADYPGAVFETSASHWAVGHVETLRVEPDAPAAVAELCRILEELESYPALDEEELSAAEFEDARESWDSWARSEAQKIMAGRWRDEAAAEYPEDETVAEVVGEVIGELDGETFDAAFGGMPDFETGSEGAHFPDLDGDGARYAPELSDEYSGLADLPATVAEALEAARAGARLLADVIRAADPALPPPSPGILEGIRAAAREAARKGERVCRLPAQANKGWAAAVAGTLAALRPSGRLAVPPPFAPGSYAFNLGPFLNLGAL